MESTPGLQMGWEEVRTVGKCCKRGVGGPFRQVTVEILHPVDTVGSLQTHGRLRRL
ncbi:MAG: hypothetical protein Ct9H90mP8_2730 [Pseudomonadota bacterium]|nr:MAG: hypothetical protein Ct9H90mP8_2730 [Pseudomonadota bacterium]